MEIAQQDLGSDSGDDTLITTMGTKGTPISNNSDSMASTSYLNEPVGNE